VADLEKLLRTAIFKPAAQLIGQLLQEAADRIDAAYQPKPGEVHKGRHPLEIQGIFGFFTLQREVLRVGAAAATWQRRESAPQACGTTVLYVERRLHHLSGRI